MQWGKTSMLTMYDCRWHLLTQFWKNISFTFLIFIQNPNKKKENQLTLEEIATKMHFDKLPHRNPNPAIRYPSFMVNHEQIQQGCPKPTRQHRITSQCYSYFCSCCDATGSTDHQYFKIFSQHLCLVNLNTFNYKFPTTGALCKVILCVFSFKSADRLKGVTLSNENNHIIQL